VSTTGSFDARELFAALARHDVEYVTIGGIALQAHGGQHQTQGLDIAIAESAENAARLASALIDLDARVLGPDGQRSQSVPSAPPLASSDRWHLITPLGPLDVLTLPAHLESFADAP
jgi:anaerobic glycerol-3-phosphate dehydrogenase